MKKISSFKVVFNENGYKYFEFTIETRLFFLKKEKTYLGRSENNGIPYFVNTGEPMYSNYLYISESIEAFLKSEISFFSETSKFNK